jgi:hypothetical protein
VIDESPFGMSPFFPVSKLTRIADYGATMLRSSKRLVNVVSHSAGEVVAWDAGERTPPRHC